MKLNSDQLICDLLTMIAISYYILCYNKMSDTVIMHLKWRYDYLILVFRFGDTQGKFANVNETCYGLEIEEIYMKVLIGLLMLVIQKCSD